MTTIQHTIANGACTTCGETTEWLSRVDYLPSITSKRVDARYMVVEPINGGTDWYVESYHATYWGAVAEAERLNVEDPMREHPYVTMF